MKCQHIRLHRLRPVHTAQIYPPVLAYGYLPCSHLMSITRPRGLRLRRLSRVHDDVVCMTFVEFGAAMAAVGSALDHIEIFRQYFSQYSTYTSTGLISRYCATYKRSHTMIIACMIRHASVRCTAVIRR